VKLSVTHHVESVLNEKGLDKSYIIDKLNRFSNAKTNQEAPAMSRFLDPEGRAMLASRLKINERDLNGFYNVIDHYRW
jgi:hypothetical protein